MTNTPIPPLTSQAVFTPNNNRIQSLDVLRGFALLGILLVNMYSFALPETMRYSPLFLENPEGVNRLLWNVIHIFVDSKFITLFSILFGASLWFFSEHKKALADTKAPFIRRNLWLLVLGLLHAYFLWEGDILVAYAIFGMVAWALRFSSNRRLLIFSSLMIIIPHLFINGMYLMMYLLMRNTELDTNFYAHPTADEIAAEILSHQQSWLVQIQERALDTLLNQIAQMIFDWSSLAMMLWGVVLARAGWFGNSIEPNHYRRVAGACITFGLCFTLFSFALSEKSDFAAEVIYSWGYTLHYLGAILLATGYSAVLMLWCRSSLWQSVQNKIASLGKMALSGYIAQSVICTTLFNGYGFGLFAQLQLWQLVLLTLGIWILQIWFAGFWLRHYQFGPLEWVWRSLTYGRRQPLKRISPSIT